MKLTSAFSLAVAVLFVTGCSQSHNANTSANAGGTDASGVGGNGADNNTVGILSWHHHRHDMAMPVAVDMARPAADLATTHAPPDLAKGGGGTGTGGTSPFIDTAGGIHAFLTFDQKLTAAQIPGIAPRTDFVWGAYTGYVSTWRQANPKIVLSYYIPFDQDGTGCDINCWKASHPDWVVYKCDKTTPSTAPGYAALDLDITNPAVQAWQQQQIQKASTQGYDGIAFDLFQLDNNRGKCGIWRNGQWVQLWNGSKSDAKYSADILAWQKATYAYMHSLPHPLLFIPNYVLDRSPTDAQLQQLMANTDAVLDEEAAGNYGYYTVDQRWIDRVTFARNLQAAGKAYFALSGFPTVDAAAMNWALATYLMEKEHAAAVYIGPSSGGLYGADAWHGEYTSMIGGACGAMSAQQNAYARTFQHGFAVVNPSSSATVTFTLPAGTYTDLYGKAVSGSLSLGPHTGAVLVRTDAPSC